MSASEPARCLGLQAARRVSAVFGSGGAGWLERLPGLLADLSRRWELAEVGGPFPGARAAFVAPAVDRLGRRVVLKVSPELEWAEHEYVALTHWSGRGSVRALAFDPELSALLMERTLPGVSLRDAGAGEAESTRALVGVIRRLRETPHEARKLPHINSWLTGLAQGIPSAVSTRHRNHLELARRLAGELLGSSPQATVLHGDLHHDNLLRQGADWVAIDPKGVVGPVEVEPAAFLRNLRPLRELPDAVRVLSERTAFISDQLGYEPSRVSGWAYVLTVLAATWAQEDSAGAQEVAEWLGCADALRGVHESLINA